MRKVVTSVIASVRAVHTQQASLAAALKPPPASATTSTLTRIPSLVSSATAAAIATPTQRRLLSSEPRVGDLPRSRSVQQEQLAERSNRESTAATGRPAAWPARSPDAPPDPATRRGGRETMPGERDAEEAARLTIRHGSGKSAEAIMAGPEAAEAAESNTAVKFVYQQEPSPDTADVGVGNSTDRTAERVARRDAEVAGSGSGGRRGGPTYDIPELGGMAGVFGPHGEMGREYGIREARQVGSRSAAEEAGGGRRTESEMLGTAGGSGAAKSQGRWSDGLAGNGIQETVKAGVGRLQEAYQQMFGSAPRGVDNDRPDFSQKMQQRQQTHAEEQQHPQQQQHPEQQQQQQPHGAPHGSSGHESVTGGDSHLFGGGAARRSGSGSRVPQRRDGWNMP